MVKKIELKAKVRENEKDTLKNIRKQGKVPAVLYGAKKDNVKLLFKYHDFDKAYAGAGESSLIDLKIGDNKSIKVIVKDVQKDPIKDYIIHADLYRVDMNKKIEVEVPLNFIGEAKAVKELGGILIKAMETLQVSSLPGDLIKKIDVDLSKLDSFDAGIKVSDVKISDSLELISAENALIASVVEPKVVVEEKEEEKKEDEKSEEKKEEGAEADKDKKKEKKK
ncbi:MAG: 50S ribosomal protein L25, partial [Patescibacteria group bacterium]|nr:50S ribosomal protein L25 [Patescibacteria group bacterium]